MTSDHTKIITDYSRAVEISRAAVDMLHRRDYPFSLPQPFPDAIVPEGINKGSLEHSLFLFYACNFDSSMRANVVYESMRGVASNIDLTLLPLMNPKMVLESFKPYLRKMGDPEKTLLDPINVAHYNGRKLQEEYGGDPRNLLGRTAEQTVHNICYGKSKKSGHKFKQYGIGKAALLMKNYVRFGIWPISEYELPIKIDRHLLRMSAGTKVVILPPETTRGRIDGVVNVLTKLYQKVTSKEKISAVELNDAFWAIGSYLCVRNDDIGCHLNCPLGCSNRPKIDERLTWYYPQTEHREDTNNLFRFSKSLILSK
jgi:hypothetical protein